MQADIFFEDDGTVRIRFQPARIRGWCNPEHAEFRKLEKLQEMGFEMEFGALEDHLRENDPVKNGTLTLRVPEKTQKKK